MNEFQTAFVFFADHVTKEQAESYLALLKGGDFITHYKVLGSKEMLQKVQALQLTEDGLLSKP